MDGFHYSSRGGPARSLVRGDEPPNSIPDAWEDLRGTLDSINPSPVKVVDREKLKGEIADNENLIFQGVRSHPRLSVNPIHVPQKPCSETLPKAEYVSYPRLLAALASWDALLLMPRFAHTIKSLLMNKEKLLELAKISLNEN
ncbi:hypothetical protein Tco_0287667 [Tanacetum coccineum]